MKIYYDVIMYIAFTVGNVFMVIILKRMQILDDLNWKSEGIPNVFHG